MLRGNERPSHRPDVLREHDMMLLSIIDALLQSLNKNRIKEDGHCKLVLSQRFHGSADEWFGNERYHQIYV